MHTHVELKLPPGMVIQLHADGIHRILLAQADIVKCRDFIATLANELTDRSLQYLRDLEVQEEQKKIERQEKIKRVPLDLTPALKKEQVRVGTEKFETISHLVPEPTIEPEPEPLPLIAVLPKRTVMTTTGEIEVDGDVTDDELNKLGFKIISFSADKSSNGTTIPNGGSVSANE